jgi:hypothetical protein
MRSRARSGLRACACPRLAGKVEAAYRRGGSAGQAGCADAGVGRLLRRERRLVGSCSDLTGWLVRSLARLGHRGSKNHYPDGFGPRLVAGLKPNRPNPCLFEPRIPQLILSARMRFVVQFRWRRPRSSLCKRRNRRAAGRSSVCRHGLFSCRCLPHRARPTWRPG